MGRKTKLNEKVKDIVCDYIRKGNTYEAAAAAAGIWPATIFNWKKWGERAKTGKYFDFLEEVKRAELEAERLFVEAIAKAAFNGTWQAAAWFLERRRAEGWARKDHLDLTSGGEVIKIKQVILEMPEVKENGTTGDGND